MRSANQFVRVATAISAIALGACLSDPVTSPGTGTIPPGSAVLSGNITTSRTLFKDTVYTLSGYVKVKSGTVLTIQAGTKIIGDTTVDGSSLWITRGGKIDAQGTATSPIVFTSARAPGNRAPGDWGGIIIVGNAIDNRSQGGGATTIFTEGPQGSGQNTGENFGGGTDANDNSGVMRYVRIEFAGFAVLPDQELNSLSMYTVGRGSQFEYIQAINGLDDSFEWFGGSVDMSHLVSYEAGDDHFDWTEGYNGRNQFMIALQTFRPTPRSGAGFASVDPRGFEGDGCETDKPGCPGFLTAPLSEPVFANFTLIGTGPGVFNFSGFKDANGIVIRRGAGATLVNGIVSRWQGIGLDIRDADTETQRLRDSLYVSNVLFTENGNGNFDAAGPCNSSGGCGTKVNFPSNMDMAVPAVSLFVGVPAAGVAPASGGAIDWSLSATSPARTGGITAFSATVLARVANWKYGVLAGTSYMGAAEPGGVKWWDGWTVYYRN